MASAVHAWVEAGQCEVSLVNAFALSVPKMAPHQRAPLLNCLVRGAGLTVSLRLLLAQHLATADEVRVCYTLIIFKKQIFVVAVAMKRCSDLNNGTPSMLGRSLSTAR